MQDVVAKVWDGLCHATGCASNPADFRVRMMPLLTEGGPLDLGVKGATLCSALCSCYPLSAFLDAQSQRPLDHQPT